MYLYQGLDILECFSKYGLYYGDYKGENLLITFSERKIKIGDLGTVLKKKGSNKLKAVDFRYTILDHQMIKDREPFSDSDLEKNDIFAFVTFYTELLTKMKKENIRLFPDDSKATDFDILEQDTKHIASMI